MAWSTSEISVNQYGNALNLFTALAKQIRDGTGDLAYSDVNLLQRYEADLRAYILDVQRDYNISPASTELLIADKGGPATATDLQNGHNDLVAKYNLYEVQALLAARSPAKSELVIVQSRTYLNGVDLKTIELASAIPATFAGPLRVSTELADVIAAAELIGG